MNSARFSRPRTGSAAGRRASSGSTAVRGAGGDPVAVCALQPERPHRAGAADRVRATAAAGRRGDPLAGVERQRRGARTSGRCAICTGAASSAASRNRQSSTASPTSVSTIVSAARASSGSALRTAVGDHRDVVGDPGGQVAGAGLSRPGRAAGPAPASTNRSRRSASTPSPSRATRVSPSAASAALDQPRSTTSRRSSRVRRARPVAVPTTASTIAAQRSAATASPASGAEGQQRERRPPRSPRCGRHQLAAGRPGVCRGPVGGRAAGRPVMPSTSVAVGRVVAHQVARGCPSPEPRRRRGTMHPVGHGEQGGAGGDHDVVRPRRRSRAAVRRSAPR